MEGQGACGAGGGSGYNPAHVPGPCAECKQQAQGLARHCSRGQYVIAPTRPMTGSKKGCGSVHGRAGVWAVQALGWRWHPAAGAC